MQDFKRVLDLACSLHTGGLNNLIFFDWLSNLKNRVLLNGFKIVQNEIPNGIKIAIFSKNYKKLLIVSGS